MPHKNTAIAFEYWKIRKTCIDLFNFDKNPDNLKMSSEKLLNNTEEFSISEMFIRLKSSQRRFFLLLFSLCGLIFLIIHIVVTQPEFNQYNILKSYNWNRHRPNTTWGPRSILLWNSFFEHRQWRLPADTLGPDYFKEQGCPVFNCEITNNKDFLPAIEMFNAIVFHVAEPFPFLNSIPRRRDADQHYVFALMEPPGETKHILGDEGGFYNLTMTYRLDSDILWPYMYIQDIESGSLVAPALSPTWRAVPSEFTDENLDEIIKGKKKFAAWFVSHCETLSKREDLTKSLQQYIEVDVYGACGPLKCPQDSEECDRMLDDDYKFYFAFENSLCLDYVTEKFYNSLKRHIIPVVFGGANYNRIAPPHSYINAESFKNVKELADYLIYLSNNPKEYARYFWWRQYYRLTFKSPFCDLCAKINAPASTKKVQFYSDIEVWWLGDTCYFEPKIWL